jgi:hypothetical protein
MPTGFVYAPVSGWISQGPGCNGSHVTCPPGNGSDPVDVAGIGTIYFYCNYPTVQSVHVAVGTLCCGSGDPTNYRQTVTIQLYGHQNGGCLLGAVRYGHMNLNMELTTGLQNITKTTYRLGTTISTKLCDSGCCYTGIHVHMQRSGGTTLVNCGQQNINAGTTAIYRFDVPICPTSAGSGQ